MTFCFFVETRLRAREKRAVFIDCQITEPVHRQGVRVSFGVVLLNPLEGNNKAINTKVSLRKWLRGPSGQVQVV